MNHDHDLPDWFMAIVDWVMAHPWWTVSLFVGTGAVVAGVVLR